MRHLQILCDFVDANETFFLSKLKMLELLRWSLANVGNSNYQTISEKKSRTRLRFTYVISRVVRLRTFNVMYYLTSE